MRVAGPIDYETTNTYELTVEVSDGLLTDTATLTIDVVDVNGAPTLDDLQANVPENAVANRLVTTVVRRDVDGDALTYSITGGNGAGDFDMTRTQVPLRWLASSTSKSRTPIR